MGEREAIITYFFYSGEIAGGVVTHEEHEPEPKKAKAPPPLQTTPPSDGLKYDQHLILIGRAMKDPLLHLCEICTLPILIYGRMVRGGGVVRGEGMGGMVRGEGMGGMVRGEGMGGMVREEEW